MGARKKISASLVGESPAMSLVLDQLAALKDCSRSILIEGEMGSGREMVGRALHRQRCGTDDTLVVQSAVTTTPKAFDALLDHAASQTHQGTLMIKDVGELSPASQRKLLQWAQSDRRLNLLVTTDLGLRQAADQGFFDADLYRVFDGCLVSLPPLRSRVGDISTLAETLVEEYVRELSKTSIKLSARALERLRSYPWPGNVAELKQVVRRLVVQSKKGRIDVEDIDILLPRLAAKVPVEQMPFEEMVRMKLDGLLKAIDGYPTGNLYEDVIKRVEAPLLSMVMKHTGYNQLRAAEILGLNRNTLRRKLTEHRLRSQPVKKNAPTPPRASAS